MPPRRARYSGERSATSSREGLDRLGGGGGGGGVGGGESGRWAVAEALFGGHRVRVGARVPRGDGGEGGASRHPVMLEKKSINELIRKAIAVKDHLAQFPAFCNYERNGLSVYLESGRGDRLPLPTRKYIQNLLKVNMEGPYGAEWPSEEKVKRREMVAPEARYIFVRQCPNGFVAEKSLKQEVEVEHMRVTCNEDSLLGFIHYRFVVEEDVPVVYVYELQMEPSVQGKGLGKFLMHLVELIACKNQMGAVMLTVQKANVLAMAFYTRLRYIISSTSPSRVDPLIGAAKSYEILCKTFDSEAKTKLEEGDELRNGNTKITRECNHLAV